MIKTQLINVMSALLLTMLSACSFVHYSDDENFGASVNQAIDKNIQNHKVLVKENAPGMNGEAAKLTVDKYLYSFKPSKSGAGNTSTNSSDMGVAGYNANTTPPITQ